MNIKEIVKNNTAYFKYYRHNHIYYTVTVADVQYIFPIELDSKEIGDSSFNDQEKAITLMRYINMALKAGTFVKYYS